MLFLSIYFFLYPSFYSKSCSHPVLGNHSSPSILIIQVFPRTCCHKKATKNQIENDPVLTQRHRKWSEIAALFLPPKDCGKGGGAYLFSTECFRVRVTSDLWVMVCLQLLRLAGAPPLHISARPRCAPVEGCFSFSLRYISPRWFRLQLRTDAENGCAIPGVRKFH